MNFEHMLCETAQSGVSEITAPLTTQSVDKCIILHSVIVTHMLNQVVLAFESVCATVTVVEWLAL